jgi:hypothetical protein
MIGFKASFVLAGIREHPRNITIAALALAIVVPLSRLRHNAETEPNRPTARPGSYSARCKHHAGD